jgi:DNA polymerase-3 subunit epsilon
MLKRYWKKFYYMLEVVLDTETTGLSTTENHKIVEIGCIELDNQIPTNKVFHAYINPQRTVSEDAYKVHGYSNEFLSNKKIFSEICEDFLSFIKDKKLIIHNAAFDLAFLNHELRFVNKKTIDKANVIDTLEIARSKYPGSQNSLDALCKRFNIDSSRREKHSALIDCNLLKEVYVNLLDQKAPKLNLERSGIVDFKFDYKTNRKKNMLRKIVKLNDDELKLHKKYLQSQLPKNNFN